jgi:hypothetical protein
MRIHFSFGLTRKKPRVGDRRTTKKHGEQIRVFRMIRDIHGLITGYDCTGGSQKYDWVPLADAEKRGVGYCLTAEEKTALKKKRDGSV